MYIQPDSDIKILHNVPLDADYINTVYFANATAQYTYFNSCTKYSFVDQSYQRVTKGIIRIQRKTDDLYDCNYLMFRNTAFGNKWFYAFITSIDYINDITSEIHFEIDVLQTWAFDYNLNYVFVEREHTVTDNVGDNIVPENLPTGELIYNSYSKELDFGTMCIIIAIVDIENATVDGNVYDGVYGGATLYAYPLTSNAMNNINTFLSDYIQSPDSIISIYMCDYAMIDAGTIPDTGKKISFKSSAIKYEKTYTFSDSDSLDGYTPKNKKLYTYPYNYFHIDNGQGDHLELRYEFFSGYHQPRLMFEGTITQPIELCCRPTGYKGVHGSSGSLDPSVPVFDETITIKGYPLCSWNMDTFKAWVAQNSIPILGDTLKTMAFGAIGATGNLQAGTELNNITNVITQGWKAKIASDMNKGSFVNGGVNVANNRMTFNYGRKSVNRQMAKIIDDYFNKFGYACNEVKIPSRVGRPCWNYVKTMGCTIHGSIPTDDEQKICSIYDRGVTFWHDASKVGDYSQNNSPS